MKVKLKNELKWRMMMINVDSFQWTFAFCRACMIWICNANTNLPVDLLGNGTCTALVTEVTTSPIRWIGKHPIACESSTIIIKHCTSTLGWLKMGNLLVFFQVRCCNERKYKCSISFIDEKCFFYKIKG